MKTSLVIKTTDLRFTRAWPLLVLALGGFLLFQTVRDNLRSKRRQAAAKPRPEAERGES